MPVSLKKVYENFLLALEKWLVFLTVGGFIGGVLLGRASPAFTDWVNESVESFVDGYGYVAPVAIFLIMCPSLVSMFKSKALGRFGIFAVWWAFIRKIFACVWAAIFTTIVFQFPLLPQHSASVADAITQTSQSLLHMMATSPYFWAMYISVAIACLASRVPFLSKILEKLLQGIEVGGRWFMPFIPLFMLAIGGYVYGLPANLAEQIEFQEGMESALQPFYVLGLQFNPKSSFGMIWIYVFGSFLVGICCFIWHCALLVLTKMRVKRFSIRSYFKDYWIKIYPLLWSTSSEALSTPLNLYLTKRYAPWVDRVVRRFVVGLGSYMNINGTLICVIVLGGIVFSIIGYQVSFIEWLLLIPVVVLISYGVPGIPGELVLFAGPIATMLNLPEAIAPTFLAIYIGLQIGLPDSFRTGNNSTDNFVFAILLNDIYEKKFKGEGEDPDAE